MQICVKIQCYYSNGLNLHGTIHFAFCFVFFHYVSRGEKKKWVVIIVYKEREQLKTKRKIDILIKCCVDIKWVYI